MRGLGLEARERGHDPVGADADGRAAVAEEEVPRGAGVPGPTEHAARRRGAAPARLVAGPAGLPATGLSGARQGHGGGLGGGARVPGPAAIVPPSPGGQARAVKEEEAETGASEAGRRGRRSRRPSPLILALTGQALPGQALVMSRYRGPGAGR